MHMISAAERDELVKLRQEMAKEREKSNAPNGALVERLQ